MKHWEPLWKGYLEFYKTSVPAATTDTTWSRLLDPAEPMHVLGAFGPGRDGEETLLGIVHYLYDYSPDMEYLEVVGPVDFTSIDATGP